MNTPVSASRLLVIVGAGPGISLATAGVFGAHGYTVALVARREQALRQYCNGLQERGVRCLYRAADAGDEAALGTALAAIQAEAGAPEVLLYNTARIKWQELLDDTAAGLTADFAVNVAGALTAVRAVLPGMRAANSGTLLFTGSMFAIEPSPAFGSLSVSKAALRNLAHGLARSLAGTPLAVHYLNIQGQVKADDATRSPAAIAERCWQLHAHGGAASVDVVI